MQYFYSPQERGVFNSAIHPEGSMPDDVIPITAQQRREIVDGIAAGKQVELDAAGQLRVVETVADPALAHERRCQQARYWRDGEIERVKWLRERHRDEQDQQLRTTLTAAQFASLLWFIQLLREWPQSPTFPDPAQRPVAPAWIAEQT
jgi:hypothetical protein